MRRLRTLASAFGIPLLLALVAWGCSGADEAPAAAQPVAAATLDVSSPSFQELVRPRKRIPKKNSCYGEDISPPLNWSGVPQGAKSLALIVEEPEEKRTEEAYYAIAASFGSVHWVLYNIPPDVTGLPERVPTTTDVLPDGTIQGVNGVKETQQMGYSGPCPPPSITRRTVQPGRTAEPPHEFYFKVYALDTELDLAPGATRNELTAAMEGHILAYGETMGKYQGPRVQGWYTDDSGTPIKPERAPIIRGPTATPVP